MIFFVLTVQMLHGKLLIFTVVQDFLPKNMQPPTTLTKPTMQVPNICNVCVLRYHDNLCSPQQLYHSNHTELYGGCISKNCSFETDLGNIVHANVLTNFWLWSGVDASRILCERAAVNMVLSDSLINRPRMGQRFDLVPSDATPDVTSGD